MNQITYLLSKEIEYVALYLLAWQRLPTQKTWAWYIFSQNQGLVQHLTVKTTTIVLPC